MFNQQGLSLDQAPPISVVFRFFLSGSLFGILGGVMLLLFDTDCFDFSKPETLMLVHTFTLGVMLSIMFGALFQMLPVVAGVKLRTPTLLATIVQATMVPGIVALLLAFDTQAPLWFVAASVLLAVAILGASLPMLYKLLRLSHHGSASGGMRYAIVGLLATFAAALYMTGTFAGWWDGAAYLTFKRIHYTFGLFGWIALLILSISFQVIEMFYVTPPYPAFFRKFAPLVVFSAITAFAAGLFMQSTALISAGKTLLYLTIALYAALTLHRLSKRKRPLADATVRLWRLGTACAIVSVTLLGITDYIGLDERFTIAGYIFFAAFALSVVLAMFYKIVPFLTWFHLNAQGYLTAPMMHEVIHPKIAMRHFYLHSATIATLIGALFLGALLYLSALLLIVSFGWMAYLQWHAWHLYRHTQKTGERFEMPSSAS